MSLSRWRDHVQGGTRESGGLAPLSALPLTPLRPETGPPPWASVSPSRMCCPPASSARMTNVTLCDGALRKGCWWPGFPSSVQ